MSPDFSQPVVLRRMLSRLPVQQLPGGVGSAGAAGTFPLAGLTTRETSDPAIALLDAWAGVIDIMSFYQDRIEAEGYLATAEEDRSLIEFDRTVGYQPRPGLAAGTALSFTVSADPGLPAEVVIPGGLAVQSIPGQDQQPQVFETLEAGIGRAEWNLVGAVSAAARPLSLDAQSVDTTAATGLQPNDPLLLVGDTLGQSYLPRVTAVVAAADGGERVLFRAPLRTTPGDSRIGADVTPGWLTNPVALTMPGRAAVFGHDAPPIPDDRRRRTGGLYHFDPFTQEWVSVQAGLPAGTISAAASIPGPAASLVVIVDGSGLQRSADLGRTWQQPADPLNGRGMRALCTDERGRLYVGGDDGTVLRSLDAGDSWQQLTQGATMERRIFLRQRAGTAGTQRADFDPAGLADQLAVAAGALPRTPVHALAAAAGLLVAGTDDGVFRSADGGLTWQLTLPLAGVRSLAFAAGELVVTTTTPDVMYRSRLPAVDTTDVRGEAWDPGSGPRMVASPPANRPGGVVIGTDSALYLTGSDPISVGLQGRGVTALAGTPSGVLVAIAPGDYLDDDWPALSAQPGQNWVDLDHTVPAVGSWLALRNGDRNGVWAVSDASAVLPADVTTGRPASAPVTRIWLGDGPALAPFLGAAARTTEVLLSGPALALAGDAVAGSRILLDTPIAPLPAGRRIVVTGRPFVGGNRSSGVPGPVVGEAAQVAGMADGRTIVLQTPLRERYEPGSVAIRANVVLASHGQQVVGELLGSGDATVIHQSFTLARSPLTALPADTDTGDRNVVTVQVDGVAWREVPALLGSGPTDRVFVIRRDSAGNAEVVFGDGLQGARPGTGVDNITADYRFGLGAAGNVPADAVVLLQTRPLGVQEVTNPLPATGGTDPETPAQSRPLLGQRILALGRLVTAADVEHFARSFAGIANAQATMLSAGGRGLLHLTVAGVDGAPVPLGSALYASLVAAINSRRSLGRTVQVDSFEPMLFDIGAHLLIDGSRPVAAITDDIGNAIRHEFGVARPGFGVPLHRGRLIALIQAVRGVVAVDLDRLAVQNGPAGGPPVAAVLSSDRARWVAGAARPSQLLLPGVITLSTTTKGGR